MNNKILMKEEQHWNDHLSFFCALEGDDNEVLESSIHMVTDTAKVSQWLRMRLGSVLPSNTLLCYACCLGYRHLSLKHSNSTSSMSNMGSMSTPLHLAPSLALFTETLHTQPLILSFHLHLIFLCQILLSSFRIFCFNTISMTCTSSLILVCIYRHHKLDNNKYHSFKLFNLVNV